MEEDEDYEIDMEIARELAAEKKALEDAIDRRRREEELRRRKSNLFRAPSLPDNFAFNFSGESSVRSSMSVPRPSNPWSIASHSPGHNDYRSDLRRQSGPVITVDKTEDHFVVDKNNSETGDNKQLQPFQSVVRKFSDVTIVDEDSTQLTQFLLPVYPELAQEADAISADSLSWSNEAGPSDSPASIPSGSLSLQHDTGYLQESQL